jgi:hypothetical protein
MLKRIVDIASSRWTKFLLLGLWILSLLWMINQGWYWEGWEVIPGGIEYRRDYFDIRRTPLFVWLTLILLGYIAHKLKRRSLGYYGLIQVTAGLVGGFIAVSKLPLTDVSAWLALLASAFAIVNGSGTVAEAVAPERK